MSHLSLEEIDTKTTFSVLALAFTSFVLLISVYKFNYRIEQIEKRLDEIELKQKENSK